jgi:hypothetical protein
MGEGESGLFIIDPMTKEGGGKKFYAFCNFTEGKIRGFIIIKKLIKIITKFRYNHHKSRFHG